MQLGHGFGSALRFGMNPVPGQISRAVAETGFSVQSALRLDDGTGWSAAAYGAASRRFGIANCPETPFGIASGTKGFTALSGDESG